MRITLRLRLLTPAFIDGFDSQQNCALRAPSLKGLLRFWWRATQAGNDDMRAEEAALFGDATSSGQSSFSIAVKAPDRIRSTRSSPPSDNNTRYFVHGRPLNILEYLAYGTYNWDKDKKKNVFTRGYIPENSVFDVVLSSPRDGASKDDVFLALKTLCCFGSVGCKSRNGFGSLDVVSVTGADRWRDELLSPNPEGLADQLKSHEAIPEYTAFSQHCRLFTTPAHHPSWHACLAELGHAYRNARLALEPRHKYQERQFIGAPLIVNKRQESLLERRAKPYFLKVLQCGQGYKGMILYLPSRYCGTDCVKDHSADLKALNMRFLDVCQRMNEELAKQLEVVR